MKILLFDIETAPMLANIWRLWSETNSMKMVDSDWYMLSWSAKWLGEKKLTTKGLPDYPTYKKKPCDDKALCKELWALLDEADIVVGHNAKKFDCKKVNARFLIHGIKPPSPYKVVDTLLAARSQFAFSSNKLDDLGDVLGLGRKVEHEGFELWRKCMNGEKKAWKTMLKYNEQDVVLLEAVYLRLLPYIKNHPNVNVNLDQTREKCGGCGSTHLVNRGYAYTNTSKFQRYVCKDCGKWGRGRKNMLDKDYRKNIQANIV